MFGSFRRKQPGLKDPGTELFLRVGNQYRIRILANIPKQQGNEGADNTFQEL
jgi:hypothetical protein